MRRDASSPEAYRADVEGRLKDVLEEVRKVILDVAPDGEEKIGYGMLDYPGLANLGAQKDYVALYVAPEVLSARKIDFPGVSAGKRSTSVTRRRAPHFSSSIQRPSSEYTRQHGMRSARRRWWRSRP